MVLASVSIGIHAQQLAFPGAEGYGAYASGGRGGTVVHVTNLNDSGAGSLAEAVSKPGRIVVFEVGGVIDITKSNLTIASNITINPFHHSIFFYEGSFCNQVIYI